MAFAASFDGSAPITMIQALRPITYLSLSLCWALPLLSPQAFAQLPGEAPISRALEEAGPDVLEYNDHVVFLASPFLEGRLPGTRGMEIAKEYVEHWFDKAGLTPAFEGLDGLRTSFRQPFALGLRRTLERQSFHIEGLNLVVGEDYSTTGHGSSADLEGELCFVGYGISEGPDGYTGFPEDCDLEGKICVVLRFEPLNTEGTSRWVRRGWSLNAGFQIKFNALASHGAAAILLVNTPGAADPRTDSLLSASGGVEQMVDLPVVHVSTEAGARILAHCGQDLVALRKLADKAGVVQNLGHSAKVMCQLSESALVAENVGGILPGRGSLADEVVVVGAHLDHLGMGAFGSRDSASAGRVLHPGADDNASGVAGVIMIAESMAKTYEALAPEADARTVLFMAFSAEESGLNGARHYTNQPIMPIEHHALMINFDMIGRIENKRLSVSGVGTAEGMEEWVQPFFDTSGLTIVSQAGTPAASDHYTFYQKRVPVLFGIIADFHDDYHTPRDTSDKINRVDAVVATHMFTKIATSAALRPEPFHFKKAPRGRRPPQRSEPAAKPPAKPQPKGDAKEGGGKVSEPPPRAKPAGTTTPEPVPPTAKDVRREHIKVCFGIRPGSYEQGTQGILVGCVTEGSPAETAGVKEGDLLIQWDKHEVTDVKSWMCMLAKHKVGDQLKVVVLRDEQRVKLDVTLAPVSRR